MANYQQHTQFNLFLFLPFCLFSLWTLQEIHFLEMASLFGCFVYATFFMNPDLDLLHQVKLFSIRGVFTLPFRGYSYVFRHRGLSHHPIFGTLSRLVWAFAVYLLIFFILYENRCNYRFFVRYFLEHKAVLYYGLLGVFLADIGHLLKDGLPKYRKRKRR